MDAAAQWAARAGSFDAAAAAYVRGRPGYPAAALRWCLPEPVGTAVDLGAGTGKLTAGLLALGTVGRVLAVEPLPGMRSWVPAPALVAGGRAEQLPVRDDVADAVLVGQAFHWFDQSLALPELVRVLRPGGRIGLLWNVFDDTVPWVAALADEFGAEDRLSRNAEERPPFGDRPGLTAPQRRAFPHRHRLDVAGLVDTIASRSQVILLEPAARAALLDRVRAAAPGPVVELPLVCQAWRCRRAG